MWADLKVVLGYRNTMLLFLVPGAFSGIILMFAGLWGVPFLTTHYGFSTARGGLALLPRCSSPGACRASPTGRSRSAWASRKIPYIAGLLLTMALWAAIVWVPGWSRPMLVVAARRLGVVAGAFILNFAYREGKSCPRAWRAPSRASPTWA